VSDAIVVGARPNGLIAANLLADHGWSVLVLEEQDEPGGAVKSGELTVAGHVHDLFSAFYPFAAASQVIGGLDLEEHGLRWAHAESVVAHPREDGRCAVLSRDLDRTAASLDAYAPGDGDAWRRLFKIWYRSLIDSEHLPDGLLVDLGRFQYDNSTIKVDWALREPIPWTADAARGAGTVHVAEGINELASTSEQLVSRLIPARPSLIMGQYATADPGRSPEGADTAWAYTHVPQQVRGDAGGNLTGTWDEREIEQFADRVEERVERLAPGFRGLIAGRHIFGPRELEAANANLVGGAINGGTAQAHQQLVFRPTSGHLGRPETPIGGLYLASASAHPGGGVHGGPGANAARTAIAHRRARRATFGLSGIAATAAMRRFSG
jgi:phytoene dehydrogenase-like protein